MSRDIDERCWWCDEDLEGQVLSEHIKKHPITKFEAEVANMVSVMDFCDHFCCDLPANICRVRTLAKEIERLLAQEQEKVAVLQMHIYELLGDLKTNAWEEILASVKRVEADLKKLDLTEPSSTEEGKG